MLLLSSVSSSTISLMEEVDDDSLDLFRVTDRTIMFVSLHVWIWIWIYLSLLLQEGKPTHGSQRGQRSNGGKWQMRSFGVWKMTACRRNYHARPSTTQIFVLHTSSKAVATMTLCSHQNLNLAFAYLFEISITVNCQL